MLYKCTNKECGHIEERSDARFCGVCGGSLTEWAPQQASKGVERKYLLFGSFLIILVLVVAIIVLVSLISTSHQPEGTYSGKDTAPQGESEAPIIPVSPNTPPVDTPVEKEIPLEPPSDRWGISPPVYVVCSAAVPSSVEAREKMGSLVSSGYRSGYLWIPDYESLSGKPYYLVFIGPFDTESECRDALYDYRRFNSSAYGIYVSHEPTRVTIR